MFLLHTISIHVSIEMCSGKSTTEDVVYLALHYCLKITAK